MNCLTLQWKTQNSFPIFVIISTKCSFQIVIPAPIYLLGPVEESQKSFYPDMEGCELAPDVIYLGRIGLLTTSQGLKLAYASANIDFEAVKSLILVKFLDF